MQIETPGQLVQLLDLEDVEASQIKPGDVIYHQNQVVLVEEHDSEVLKWGPMVHLKFGKKDTYDGYERSIVAKPETLIKRVRRS